MSTGFLSKHRKSYYYRIWIPKAVRSYFKGKVEVWRSLKTKDKEEARVLAHQFESHAKRLFFTLRRYGHSMTPEQIDSLVARWLDTRLELAEEYRAGLRPISENQREGAWLVLHDQMGEAEDDLLSNDFRRIEKEADELLASASLPPLDHDSAEYGRLCRRLLRAKLDYAKIEMDRWEGVYKELPPSMGSTSIKAVPISQATGLAAPQGLPPSKLFSEVVKAYHKDNPPRSPRSQQQTLAEFNTFLKVVGGDKPINYITKAECRKYKEHLRDERKNKPATVSKWLAVLSGVFRWAERQDFIPENSNPVKGLLLTKKQAREGAEHYREFTDAELLLTFGSEEFRAQRGPRPERYWICLLMLFQVCRRKEPAQLNVADVLEEDGISYLYFKHDGKEQTTKTEASVRKVPVHPALIQLGFLDYVQEVKAAGHVHLFPQLKRGRTSTLGDSVGKWFKRLKQKKGLHDSNLTLYSTRHTGITKLSNLGVPEKIRMMITGHASQGIHGQVYDRRERVPMNLLRQGLEQLHYPDVLQSLNNKSTRREAA
ncbi:MAG: site-specific integrase [Nitrospira sp.]|nr:site-specific integrase [Nitrospira sp.]